LSDASNNAAVPSAPTQTIIDGIGVTTSTARNLNSLDFAVRDGSPNVPAGTPGLTADGFISASGTYHVNPDCTGAGAMSQSNLATTTEQAAA
jgi:hypothetical protein